MMANDPFAPLLDQIVAFRDERDWGRFHTVRNLSAALSIEAAELQETVLWKADEEIEACLEQPEFRTRLGREVADVLIYALLIAQRCGMGPAEIIDEKLRLNAIRYPVELAKGTAKKYTDLTSSPEPGESP